MATKNLLYQGWNNSISYNQWDIIAHLVNHYSFKIGVELGIGQGENFKKVVQLCPTFQWIGVDPFDNTHREKFTQYKYNPSEIRMHRQYDFKSWKADIETFCRTKNNATVMWERDLEAVKWFQDESVDIIFIDIDLSYESITRNVDAWKPKLKPTGMFCGRAITDHPERANDIKTALNDCFTKHSLFVQDFWVAKKQHIKEE